MADLHTRLHAEVERRLAIARAAAAQFKGDSGLTWLDEGGEYVRPAKPVDNSGVAYGAYGWLGEGVSAHIALHDPADAICRYEGELKVLQRHAPTDRGECPTCFDDSLETYGDKPICYRVDWPCPEVLGVAERLGIEVTDG